MRYVTSSLITLSTQMTSHSARLGLGLHNRPKSPLRRNTYDAMATPDVHGQGGVIAPGKESEYLEQ